LENLSSNNIDICNNGDKPTFSNVIRQEVLDLTLCNAAIFDKITNWHVSDEISLSDHKHIIFNWSGGDYSRTTFRNSRRTNWDQYVELLNTHSFTMGEPIDSTQKLESFSQRVNESIINSFNGSCPTIQSSSTRDVPWWNFKLDRLRKFSRKMCNRAKQTGDWTQYRKALTEYNNEIRKSKRKSWMLTCENINSTPVVARLQKTLAKDHSNELGNLKRDDGAFTKTPRETLDLMMETHFPGSVLSVDSNDTISLEGEGCPSINSSESTKNTASDLADEIFTKARVENAIRSFQPFKSAGVDGIFPALIQNGEAVLVPPLIEMFKASLRLNYVPSKWRLVKVIFIPKKGKRDKDASQSIQAN
jgi:hypothetical protein